MPEHFTVALCGGILYNNTHKDSGVSQEAPLTLFTRRNGL